MDTDADAVCRTEAERAALAALRDSGAAPPMVAHCLRQFHIAERLAGDEPYDREVLLVACWLHDAGLGTRSTQSYVQEGAELARRTLEPLGWSGERLQRVTDACAHHHATTSRRHLGLEVELVRQSDLVDASGGLIRFGLDRAWLAELKRAVPMRGFHRLIAGAVAGELRHRPRTLARVFRP
jgi:hypothetical protein